MKECGKQHKAEKTGKEREAHPSKKNLRFDEKNFGLRIERQYHCKKRGTQAILVRTYVVNRLWAGYASRPGEGGQY